MTAELRSVELIRLPIPTGSINWKDKARCTPMPQEWWFPPETKVENPAAYRRNITKAKAVCKLCTVRSDCLEYALRNREEYGVWGGLTPSERERVRNPHKTYTRPDGSVYVYPRVEVPA